MQVVIHNIDFKKLGISCGISLGVGAVSGIISMMGMENYDKAIKPPLTPPGWLFPIVWTILFILMGISSYLIYMSDGNEELTNKAMTIYAVQLLVNFFWPIIFFNMSAYLFASIWILALLILIWVMIIQFKKINKAAAYLQIPYLLWVAFATYLTVAVAVLN